MVGTLVWKSRSYGTTMEEQGAKHLARCLLFGNLSIRYERFYKFIKDWIIEE